MRRRDFLIQSALAAGATATPWRALVGAQTNGSWPGFANAVVIDALGAPGGGTFGDRVPLTAAQFADVKTSGLTTLNVTVGGVGSSLKDFEEALKNIAFWEGQIEAHPDVLMKVKTAADLDIAKKEDRCGLIYGFQDATPFGESLDRFDLFHDLGLRIIQLTYNL